MIVVGYIALAFALAFLAESLVEYVLGTPFEKFEKLKGWKWALLYVSLGVGVWMAFTWKIDLIWIIAQQVGYQIDITWQGIFLSGAIIGRGANYIHQFMTNYIPEKKGQGG